MVKRASGTREARFVALFREFMPSVRGFVRTQVPQDDAEGVIAATFVTAWESFQDIPPTTQKAWLFGIARNHICNLVRAERRRTILVDAIEGRPAPATAATPAQPADTADPFEVRSLIQALQRLPEADREIIQLAVWHEMQPNEIAQVLGIELGDARTRLHQARQRLETNLAVLERNDTDLDHGGPSGEEGT